MALPDIEHIVVLVMENRSFDRTLGYHFHALHLRLLGEGMPPEKV